MVPEGALCFNAPSAEVGRSRRDFGGLLVILGGLLAKDQVDDVSSRFRCGGEIVQDVHSIRSTGWAVDSRTGAMTARSALVQRQESNALREVGRLTEWEKL